MHVISLDHPEIAPLTMSQRFRTEIVYFMTPQGDRTAPACLGPNEYWVAQNDARRWLDDLVILVVSPLDAASKAEIGLTEEHETWLQWMVDNDIQHIRLE